MMENNLLNAEVLRNFNTHSIQMKNISFRTVIKQILFTLFATPVTGIFIANKTQARDEKYRFYR